MKPDGTSLTAGVAIAALGLLLIGDRTGVVDLDFAWLAAALAAVVGIILLVSGLDR
jgi:hypothetical protein